MDYITSFLMAFCCMYWQTEAHNACTHKNTQCQHEAQRPFRDQLWDASLLATDNNSQTFFGGAAEIVMDR